MTSYVQRIWRGVLSKEAKKDSFTSILTYNVLIYSKNIEEYKKYVRLMLQKLKGMRLYTSLGKCVFHQLEKDFFRYIIFNKNLLMDKKKVKDIKNWSIHQSMPDIIFFWICLLLLDLYQKPFLSGYFIHLVDM